jgi:hypothetical protein
MVIMKKINDKSLCVQDINEPSRPYNLRLLVKTLEEPIEDGSFIIPINIIKEAVDGTLEVVFTCTVGKLGVMLSGDENDLDNGGE